MAARTSPGRRASAAAPGYSRATSCGDSTAEALVVALHGHVALGADGREDLADGRLDPREIALAARLEAGERRFELGRTLHERREHDGKSVASRAMPRSGMRFARSGGLRCHSGAHGPRGVLGGLRARSALRRHVVRGRVPARFRASMHAAGARAPRATCPCWARACRRRSATHSAARRRHRERARRRAADACFVRAARRTVARRGLGRVRAARLACLARADRSACREPAVAIVEDGPRRVRRPPAAACPRGTTPRRPARRGAAGGRDVRPPGCPPGSLAEGAALPARRDDGGARTEAAWTWGPGRRWRSGSTGAGLARALPAARAASRRLRRCPGASERAPATARPGDAARPDGARVAVAIMLSRPGRLAASRRGPASRRGGHPLSAAAEALVSGAVGTLLEALRGLGARPARPRSSSK